MLVPSKFSDSISKQRKGPGERMADKEARLKAKRAKQEVIVAPPPPHKDGCITLPGSNQPANT